MSFVFFLSCVVASSASKLPDGTVTATTVCIMEYVYVIKYMYYGGFPACDSEIGMQWSEWIHVVIQLRTEVSFQFEKAVITAEWQTFNIVL